MKKTLFFIALLLFVPLSIVSAQTKEPVLVASINIQDAKIVSQEENVFKITFLLTNKEGMQTGVKYGVKLVQNLENKQVLVDEVVYPEVLTIMPQSSTLREITYTAPKHLSGTYALVLYSSNASGFPFGISYVGDVTVYSEEKGVTIAPETCALIIDGRPLGLIASSVVSGKNEMQLRCTVTNTLNRDVIVTPAYKTYVQTVYGEEAETTGGSFTPISLSSGAQTPVTLSLPKATTPRTYTVLVSLTGPDIVSNTITARYVIPGQSASIINASFDKEAYAKGETAKISLLWAGTSAVTLEGTVKSKTGRNCSAMIQEKLTVPKPPVTEISVTMKRDCNNPRLSLTLKSDDGTVLDQKDFNVNTTPSENEQKRMVRIGALILGGAALIAAVAVFIKRRRIHQTINNETI